MKLSDRGLRSFLDDMINTIEGVQKVAVSEVVPWDRYVVYINTAAGDIDIYLHDVNNMSIEEIHSIVVDAIEDVM